MIIFGTKARQKEIGKGQFHCPRCHTERRYIHKHARRYFTLYFIPLIPMGDLGEFIECLHCGTTFSPEARYAQPPPPPRQASYELAQQINSVKYQLENGQPVEHIVAELTRVGVERSTALGIVTGAIGPGRKSCKHCGLTYALTARNCAECGARL